MHPAIVPDMPNDRIDFISAYCDRWCERCAFTSRCATFAVEAAISMCGDAEQGVELALGETIPARDAPTPMPDPPPAGVRPAPHRDNPPILTLARAYTMLARRWLRAERETWGVSGDPILREAMTVIAWDHTLIGAKLDRAMSSRHGGDDDAHPIQNDANGSAKLALILIDRSEASWRAIAHATAGELPLMMADHLAQLRAQVDSEFPDARRFVRPGFDEAAW